VHELRNRADGLIVGIGTVLKDDPLLTCRIEGGRDPIRIILDPQLDIPINAKCLGKGSLVFTNKSRADRLDLIDRGAEIVQLEADPSGLLPWATVLEHLGKIGLHCVMVEGGSGVYSSLLKSGLSDKLLLFIAPKILGGGLPLVDWGSPARISDSLKIMITKVDLLGGDIIVEGMLEG
jgi:diaminohydroxyphosphoribosylaminopyrimidine deaminase / 5-amino-6-(5-phosphoribosylamino)uracil reductase